MEYNAKEKPRHDKTNKMSVRPAKTQISLGIRPFWSELAVRMKKDWVPSYPLITETSPYKRNPRFAPNI